MNGYHDGARRDSGSGTMPARIPLFHTGSDGVTSTQKSSGSDDDTDNGVLSDDKNGGSLESLLDPVPIITYWSSTCGNPTPPPLPWVPKMTPWRSSPGRLEAANAALVHFSNTDVDPPDVIKTNACALMKHWV